MAFPSRVYVGVVVFGLIATLMTGAYALLLAIGYTPPVNSTYSGFFPGDGPIPWGQIIFLTLACLFSLAFTVFAWRALLHGARTDLARIRRHEEIKREMREYARRKQRPPGPT